MDREDVLSRPAPLPDAVLRYDGHADAVVDVYLPASPPRPAPGPSPLVCFLHGGFWRQAYDRRHARPLAVALAGEGYVVALPEYRRVGGAGGWPATAQDVGAAVAALPGLLEGIGVRASAGTVVGHSAGGHLALWLAAQGGADRVVALAPVADLRAAAADRLGDGAAQALLGGDPADVPDAYAAADPVGLLEAGPRPGVEIVLVHGTADDVVPVSQSRSLHRACPWVVLRELAGADHFAVIDPGSAAWPAVLAAVRGAPSTATAEAAGDPGRVR